MICKFGTILQLTVYNVQLTIILIMNYELNY